MSKIAAAGAQNTGGGVFAGNAGAATPTFDGGKAVLVGDTTICPGAAGAGPGGYGFHPVDSSGNRLPFLSTVLNGSAHTNVNGQAVALVGSSTSCGHPIFTQGANVNHDA